MYLESRVFPSLTDTVLEGTELEFLTTEESLLLSKKVNDFRDNPKSRSNGAALQKLVSQVELHKKHLLIALYEIHSILKDKPRKKRSTEDEVLTKAIVSIAETWLDSDETTLRRLTDKMLGEDKSLDFTVEELPYVIAFWQVKKQIPSQEVLSNLIPVEE